MTPRAQPQQGTDRHPFLLSVEDVARQLKTNVETGLSARQVAELRNEFPPNELEGGGGAAWHKILIKQISNAMILVSWHSFWTPRREIDNHEGPCICNGTEFWSE